MMAAHSWVQIHSRQSDYRTFIYVIKNSPSDEQASSLIWQLQLLILVSEPHLDPATTTLNKYASVTVIFCAADDFLLSTRQHSSRMRTAGLTIVRVSLVTTRCQYQGVVRSHVWYLGEGVPMSQCIMGNGHIGTRSSLPWTVWQSDTCENITFPQLRLRAVITLKVSYLVDGGFIYNILSSLCVA